VVVILVGLYAEEPRGEVEAALEVLMNKN
jgi:hypothetical protein